MSIALVVEASCNVKKGLRIGYYKMSKTEDYREENMNKEFTNNEFADRSLTDPLNHDQKSEDFRRTWEIVNEYSRRRKIGFITATVMIVLLFGIIITGGALADRGYAMIGVNIIIIGSFVDLIAFIVIWCACRVNRCPVCGADQGRGAGGATYCRSCGERIG